MARSRNLVTATFDINDVRAAEKNILKKLQITSPEIAKKVSILAFDAVKALGNVPEDTGLLKSSGHKGIKDKYRPNSYLMGWTTPYAKYVYFGLQHEQNWTTEIVNGKKKRVKYYSMVGNGMPFWDYPITRNNSIMLKLYQQAMKEQKEIM